MPAPSQPLLPPASARASAGWLLLQFAAAYALWFLFVGELTVDEALFGLVGAGVTAFASQAVMGRHLAPLRARWRDVLQIWRLPRYLLSGSWLILAVLARQVLLGQPAGSLLLEVPFDPGGDDDESAVRRALAIIYSCSTPNFVVLGVDRQRGRLIYHQLRRAPVPAMTVRLGARP